MVKKKQSVINRRWEYILMYKVMPETTENWSTFYVLVRIEQWFDSHKLGTQRLIETDVMHAG